jgi:hypothetical protein
MAVRSDKNRLLDDTNRGASTSRVGALVTRLGACKGKKRASERSVAQETEGETKEMRRIQGALAETDPPVASGSSGDSVYTSNRL